MAFSPGAGDGGGKVNTLEQGVELNGGLGSAGQGALGALAGSAQAAGQRQKRRVCLRSQ